MLNTNQGDAKMNNGDRVWVLQTDKDDELRRKIGAILNNTYLKKITFN